MSDRSFFDSMFKNIVLAGTITFFVYVFDTTIENNGKIEELFSRLEKCEKNHESSHELKK